MMPDTITEPRFFAYRASLLLAVGRVDEANRDIERALQLNPNLGDAYALRSIIAIVQNDRQRGLELARKVRDRFPELPILLTTGYSEQAGGTHGFPVLQKPYEFDSLSAALQSLLKQDLTLQ